MIDLQNICETAAETGRTIDVTGCHYGLHKRTGKYLGESFYYSFLAGFVRSQKITSILEIGTHYGGSIMAMNRGTDANATIVTIDKTNLNEEGFRDLPHIHRVHGDSLKADVVKKTTAFFRPPIGLLYIDSKHTYEHVRGNLDSYAVPLQPRFVILDDIHLDDSLEKIWSELCAAHPCYDVTKLAERPCGFGVIAYGAH